MDIIHLLPDSVANQIAAGEVIQRPASVIKELVENAVDAGATRIDVSVTDAGRTALQVADNGKGMSETDARLAFERHATSKIRDAADLFALTTMGFRGEALPSIAAVSQVELTTRPSDQELGTRLVLEGSRVQQQEPVACAQGANFVVKNLFFNTPARRRFLKSNQTELNNIISEMERIVLVHPDIAFTFLSNDTPLMNLAPGSLKQRIAGVFGQRLADQLLTLSVDTPMVRISGFVGRPESSRKRGARQFFFVNHRFMRHPYFHKAVQEAFDAIIPSDEQVPYFIYLEVDPQEIDVNIHPTKTEIKFENEQPIWQILLAAIREALGRFNAIPTIDFTPGTGPEIPVFAPKPDSRPPQVPTDPAFNPFDIGPQASPRPTLGASYPLSDAPSTPDEYLIPHDEWSPAPTPESLTFSSQHYQYKGQYIMTAAHSGLMIIDQHRAHIRVLHHRYLTRLATDSIPSQRLLFPDIVHLTAADESTLTTIAPQLSRLGFELTSLGGGSWNISGVPSGIEGTSPSELLTQLLASAAESPSAATDQLLSRLALVMARAAAIPVGQVLSLAEMQDLIDKLFATPNPNITPDGKPIIVIISQDTIDKQFKS